MANSAVAWRTRLYWRIQLDNIFVVFYRATFVMGLIVARAQWHQGGKRGFARDFSGALGGTAVATALIDYWENFTVLATLTEGINENNVAAMAARLADHVRRVLGLERKPHGFDSVLTIDTAITLATLVG